LRRVKVFLHYARQKLRVKFSPEIKNSELLDGNLQFDTVIWVWQDRKSEVANYFEYACSSEECNKNFVLKHIPWLIEAQFISLHMAVGPLLVRNTQDPGKYSNVRHSKKRYLN
jgi:hypothetical protein